MALIGGHIPPPPTHPAGMHGCATWECLCTHSSVIIMTISGWRELIVGHTFGCRGGS